MQGSRATCGVGIGLRPAIRAERLARAAIAVSSALLIIELATQDAGFSGQQHWQRPGSHHCWPRPH